MEYKNTPAEQQSKLQRAKKRVEEIKGFYIHLTVYLIINIFIVVLLGFVQGGQDRFVLTWPNLGTGFFWGIGLAIHGIRVFRFNPFFGKEWEQRQIQKFIEEDKREAEKFKNR